MTTLCSTLQCQRLAQQERVPQGGLKDTVAFFIWYLRTSNIVECKAQLAKGPHALSPAQGKRSCESVVLKAEDTQLSEIFPLWWQAACSPQKSHSAPLWNQYHSM